MAPSGVVTPTLVQTLVALQTFIVADRPVDGNDLDLACLANQAGS